MKIVSTVEEIIRRKVTQIEMPNGSCVNVIDTINGTGNVIDTIYRDEATGYEVDDPTLIEEIEAFLEENAK